MKNTKTEDCTSKCERSLKDLLLSLGDRFQKHLALFQSSLDLQRNIIGSMWVISQRFLILTRGALCVSPYPREQSDREEREIRAEFKIKKDDLCNSNSKITASLESLKQECRSFDRALANTVDANLPSPIIEGNNERKPIHFYIEFYSDFLKFFQEMQKQLRLSAKILNVYDIKSILEYKNNLEPDKTEMEYFENSMSDSINGNH